MPAILFPAPWGIAVAIFLFGAAQAFIGVPQITLVSELAVRAKLPEAGAIAMTRLMERVGGSNGASQAILDARCLVDHLASLPAADALLS